jgi:hypothetical protein
MKLEQSLHIMNELELSRYLLARGFPEELPCFSVYDLSMFMMGRQVTEAEIITGGKSVCLFWSSKNLIATTNILEEPCASTVILSSLRGSNFSITLRRAGFHSSIHPIQYTPEWVDCFVFSLGAGVKYE